MNGHSTSVVSTNTGGNSVATASVAAVAGADNVPFESTGISHSAAATQMILLPEDVGVPESVLPKGATDVNGQQLDLRQTNSWLLKMDEVSTPEVMECMFVNAIAPFVLNSRLKPLMSTPTTHGNRYIVNVSAMEGKFYRYKLPSHPHTNMAKAALNMMTRTSAEDLAENHGIYMNAIDTGWINDENPLERAKKTAEQNNFQTPIDEIDAAARVVDPIFSQSKDYGKFLKDYRESEW
jgi:NAD(P)-dependent dehydrogenase (short-subunit alcohol dehydrogenase family)